MFGSTPTLTSFVFACLLLCISGGRIATAQTVADDTVNSLRKQIALQSERINELEEENRLLSESANNELQQVPTTGVSDALEGGHHNEDYGTSLRGLESKIGTLWNDIPT